MEEDIDDLLDEVESKFCKTKTTKTSGGSSTNYGSNKNIGQNRSKIKDSRVKQKDESDINSMIHDICAEDGPAYEPPSSQQTDAKTISSKARKCFLVYLGGNQYATGLSSASVKRTCDKLRCTSCDFQVVSFNNYQWNSHCDYLFFRNNIPDFSKLKVNLLQKEGWKAYACQCSWRSVSKLTDIESDSELKWVCGKHS